METIFEQYFETFRYMEYRKLIRLSGYEIFEKGNHPLLTALVIVLWLLNFVFYSITVSNYVITITFNQPSNSKASTYIPYLLGASSLFISLVLVVIATSWQIRFIVHEFAVILFLSLISEIIIEALMTGIEENNALAVNMFVCTVLLSIILLNHLWLYMYLPTIMKWKWGCEIDQFQSRDMLSNQSDVSVNLRHQRSNHPWISFPYLETIEMCLFLILIFPCLIPILLLTIIGGILQLMKLPVLAEFLSCTALFKLNKSFWKFHQIDSRVYYQRRENFLSLFFQAESPATNVETLQPQMVENCCIHYNMIHFFTYTGDVDEIGKPHGYGEWKDSECGGEVLKGFWRHGLPIGPYISRETERGGIFSSVKIGYATCSNSPVETLQISPRWIDEVAVTGGLVYGTCVVECCISGTFYKNYPMVTFYLGEPPIMSATINETLTMLENEETSNPINSTFSNYAYELKEEFLASEYGQLSYQLTLGPDTAFLHHGNDQRRGGKEALIFIPGFNSCLSKALAVLGQFLSLGQYPSTILPLVFGWPMGSIPSFFSAKAICDSTFFVQRMDHLINELKIQGIDRINFIGHSMGGRALLNVLINSEVLNSGQDATEAKNLQVGSVVFINAEADMDIFISKFPIFRKYCESISVYGDGNDIALFWAEVMNYLCSSKSENNSRSAYFCKTLGRCVGQPVRGDDGDLLDVDIINSSSIHGNVTSTRHCYFDLSRELIEDMRELIVHRKRAKFRTSRLILRDGNLFEFLIAPSYVFH